MTGKPNTREVILNAADRLIVDEGVSSLSFDNLTKATGISRGGVLYHFPSKEALIAALIERLIDRFEALLEAEMSTDPNPFGRFSRAFARATFRTDADTSAIFAALIAAIAYDPGLLAPMHHRWSAWQARAESELGVAKAAVVRMASQALWLNGIFGMNSYTPDQQQAIVAQLETLTRPLA